MIRDKVVLLSITVAILLSGCGGPDSQEPVKTSPKPEGIPNSEFNVQICDEQNQNNLECKDARGFDLNKEAVAMLLAPEDIGASMFETYEGKRALAVPIDEKKISPQNALAYGLYLYAKEAGEDWCGPCRMVAPQSYSEAKEILESKFQITGTDEQNRLILEVLNKNLELLGKQELSLKEAYEADIKAMAESLVNLTKDGKFPNPSELFPAKDEKLGTLSKSPLSISEKEAIEIAYNIRSKSDKPKPHEEVFEKLSCKTGLQKQIFMGGIADNFNPNNTEPTNPRAQFATFLNTLPSGYLHGYDYSASSSNYNIFADTIINLPTNISDGMFVVGLREKGVNFTDQTTYIDSYKLGDLALQDSVESNVSILRTTWSTLSSDIYYKELSSLTTTSGQSLLSNIQSGQNFLDVMMLPTTNVDFIAVVACTPKDKPQGEPIPPTKLECNEEKGEELLEVWGGVDDNFAPSTDPTTPSTAVSAIASNKYDQPVEKLGVFGDTLQNPNMYISQLELMINTRASALGSGNDYIFVGDVASQKGLKHDPNDNSALGTTNGGKAHFIYGSETVFDVNLTPQGDFISLLNSGIDLDIIVGDQTEVDSTRLSMCVIKDYTPPCRDSDGDGVCDEDDCAPLDPTISSGCDDEPSSCGSEITVDLSLATSWRDQSGNNPTENNVFSYYAPNPAWSNVIWDGALNWFDFGNTSNAVHKLSLDFCACGDTEIVIDEMKSDNFSKMYLDADSTPSSYTNPSYIVSRSNGISQSTMASWGPNESGSKFVPNSSGVGVDHTLHYEVKNGFGPSGGAIDGNLTFVGNLGACENSNSNDGTPDDGHPDRNITIVYGGTLAVIDGISIIDIEPEDGNGTIIVDVVGPVVGILGDKPYVINDPRPIVIDLSKDIVTPILEEDLPQSYTNPSTLPIYAECYRGYIDYLSFIVMNQSENTFYRITTSIRCEEKREK